ncbi:uncharacterized protein LOC120166962 [Hibiscus syriacus]|uniref:uncharacterized protein LOC120166962 n=1 Tax=Hibiscus syriacus TaxID=106335 RepID=UPI001922C8E3|nr:uncharacterized protein LOC120166962 [Hibiscus syriacus]
MKEKPKLTHITETLGFYSSHFPLSRQTKTRLLSLRVWTDRLEMVKARARVGNGEPRSSRAWCLAGRWECCQAYCSILMLHVGGSGVWAAAMLLDQCACTHELLLGWGICGCYRV